MAAILFADVLKKAQRAGVKYGETETRDWFRDRASRVWGIFSNPKTLIEKKTASNGRETPLIGRMFLFQYDPKHKLTLPYYDTFPLIFPIEILSDGFLGINLHYLPPLYRARLMDALYTATNNKKYDETTKLRISYDILKAAAKFSYFRPCIKRYLTGHVRSQLIEIDTKEWDYTLFLPLARFKKANQNTVWTESTNKIRNRK